MIYDSLPIKIFGNFLKKEIVLKAVLQFSIFAGDENFGFHKMLD